MDTNILKTLGQVAGIGGISLGVFLILFREIIRKNIFPNLKKDHAYSLLKLILFFVWSIAIMGIGAWIYSIKANNNSMNELISLINIRADSINTNIDNRLKAYQDNPIPVDKLIEKVIKDTELDLNSYKYQELIEFKIRFNHLHTKLIDSLSKKELIVAHEILAQIHALGSELEKKNKEYKELAIKLSILDPLSFSIACRKEADTEFLMGELSTYIEKIVL